MAFDITKEEHRNLLMCAVSNYLDPENPVRVEDVDGTYDNCRLIDSSGNEVEKPEWSEISDKVETDSTRIDLTPLRNTRDKLLQETDHWAYQDTPEMTQAQIDYRQALRDITLTYSSLEEAVFPTKPQEGA